MKNDKFVFSIQDPDELTALEAWQIQELEAGIKEADEGKFASNEDVERVLNKW